MSTRTRRMVATLAGAALSSTILSALAQQPAGEPKQDTFVFVANGVPVMPFGAGVDFIGGEGTVMGRTVTGKPYSAESITESTQLLADGNRITRTNRARVYRDSQGRTRREQEVDSLGVWQANGDPVKMITINDPVENVSYFIDPNAETARKLRPFTLELKNAAAAGQFAVGIAGSEGEPDVVGFGPYAHTEAADPAAAGEAPQTRVFTQRFEAAVPPPGAAASRGMIAGAIASFDGAAPRSAVDEDLGEQVLEGVLARGTRQTITIEAGAIGNDRPIAIVQEQWYSPDIEAIVLRRHSHPRFLLLLYRLVNVDRSEPAPELFTVPAGYTVAEPGERHLVETQGQPQSAPAPVPGRRGERGRRVFLIQPDEGEPAEVPVPSFRGDE